MPSRKKKSQAKKTGDTPKGGGRPSFDTRPVKPDSGSTSSDNPASQERVEDEGDVFFDATDDPTKVRDCAPTLAPSADVTKSKGFTRVAEIKQDPQKRTTYFPKYFSRTTRYSVGVQTVNLEKGGGGIKHPETLRWGDNDPDEMETLHLENVSSDEEYEDAMENLTEAAQLRQEGGREWMRSRVRSRDRRDQMVQVSCSKETCQETTDRRRRRRINGDGLETHPRQGSPENSVERGNQDSYDPTCCSCLLTVLYWLAVMLLVSFLLSLFLTVFLLFSRNHSLGIGPGLLYSDVEHIRNHADPYLDLRHKGPPPT